MENFNNTPAEPVKPDESERVEDVAKAQEMAKAGNRFRSEAAELRSQMEDGSLKDNGWGSSIANKRDMWAGEDEEKAGKKFDAEKEKLAKLEEVKKELGI